MHIVCEREEDTRNDFKCYLMHHSISLKSEVVSNNKCNLFFIFPFDIRTISCSDFLHKKRY